MNWTELAPIDPARIAGVLKYIEAGCPLGLGSVEFDTIKDVLRAAANPPTYYMPCEKHRGHFEPYLGLAGGITIKCPKCLTDSASGEPK